VTSAPALTLTAEQERQAERLFRENISFICHDHNLLLPDLEMLRRSGVTAKEVHISRDGQTMADRRTFLSSATRAALEGERRRVGAATGDLPEDVPDIADAAHSGRFLHWALIALDHILSAIAESGGGLVLALEPEDVVEAKRRGVAALLIGTEGSRLLQDSFEVLRALHRLGLRHLQLTWAWETSVGTPQSDRSGRGLSDYGLDLVRELNDLGVMIDVAHLSYASMADVLRTSRAPILCSHTGALALNPEQTVCIPDHLLDAIAERKGIVAVHFMSQIVKPGRHRATFAELMAQFTYIAERIGPEHVALGPDFTQLDPRMWLNAGITVPFMYAEGVEDVTRIPNVVRGLVAAGFADDEVRGILGGNLLRLFGTVRAARSGASRPRPWDARAAGALTAGTTPL
jgi:membrane dipeptidase